MSVCEKSCRMITLEYLNLVAVAATAQQETAIGRDVELTGMNGCGLVADACEQSCLAVDGKDGDTIIFQAVARIEKSAVGTQMNIRSASRSYTVRDNFLEHF